MGEGWGESVGRAALGHEVGEVLALARDGLVGIVAGFATNVSCMHRLQALP